MDSKEAYLQRIEALESDVAFLKTAINALELQIKRGDVSQGAKRPNQTPKEIFAEKTEDELLPAAVDVVLKTGQASVSMLQRRLVLGYSRAVRLMEQLEERGIVGPFIGTQPRKILITKEQWDNMQQ